MSEPASAPVARWKMLRRLFRWCRVALLLLVLSAVAAFIYFNRVGLPEFIKKPLLAELKNRGVDLQFERIRYRWYVGIVAEKVRMGQSGLEGSPRLTADEVVVRLADDALWHGNFKVTGLLIRNGHVDLALTETNRPPALVNIEDINTDLRFLPGDTWELNDFVARFQGIHLRMAGSLNNASLMSRNRSKDPESAGRASARNVWQHQVRHVKQVLEQLKFGSEPEIYLIVNADAKSPERLSGNLQLTARGVRSPWGDASSISLNAPLNAITNLDGNLRSELRLRLDQARTPWAGARQAQLDLRVDSDTVNILPVRVEADLKLVTADVKWGQIQSPMLDLKIRSKRVAVTGAVYQTEVSVNSPGVQTQWGGSKRLELEANGRHSVTGAPPEQLSLHLKARDVVEPHVKVGDLDLTLQSRLVSPVPQLPTNGWKGWQQLAPYALDWDFKAGGLAISNFTASTVAVRGRWTAPELRVDQFAVTAPEGSIDTALSFDAARLVAVLRGNSQIEWHSLSNLPGAGFAKAMRDVVWETPPRLGFDLTIPLPAPGSAPLTNWTDILAPVTGAIRLESGPVNYRGVQVKGIELSASLTNLIARISQLKITRPEGVLSASLQTDLRTNRFTGHLLSGIDPMLIKPLFKEPKTVKALNDFTFHRPPQLDLQISGAWNDLKPLRAFGTVAVRDAVYRGNWASNLTANVDYSNGVIGVTNALFVHGGRELRSTGVGVDIIGQRVWITNAVSDVDPLVVTRFIGPQTTRAIEPYKFFNPPHVLLHGSVPFKGVDKTDLHFEVEGGPFNYWKFNLPRVKASVHWVTNTLSITNVAGDFHEGRVKGELAFDFGPEKSADFQFHMTASEANMHSLMSDLVSPTNKLEGTLNVELTVTSANTADWGSWEGYGYAQLLDGFVWDIPMVGMLSPVLESMSSGLGRSRISEGLMTYRITNSIIRTKDLELKGNSMRLQYAGTCDFQGNIDARVEAELFRDSNMISRVFGYVLTPITKLFEYKVTGTLGRPKMEPLFIPKFLFFPLQPIKTLKDLFESDKPAVPKEPAPASKSPTDSPSSPPSPKP